MEEDAYFEGFCFFFLGITGVAEDADDFALNFDTHTAG